MMKVTMWGTRGSIPVWGAGFMRHGGATTCVEIELLNRKDAATPERVVIDFGTGAAELGRAGHTGWDHALMLQTHLHWDHIQGFPFFGPIFSPQSSMRFLAVDRDGSSLRDVLDGQMKAPTFPVGLDIVPATLRFESIATRGTMTIGELRLSWDEMWHPSGSTGWRLEYHGQTFVFSGDVELKQGSFDALATLAAGADLLVVDAQYFSEEYASREGWGHSTPEDAVDVAIAADVRRLLLTHHEPAHDDATLDRKLAVARDHAGGEVLVDNAFDRMTIALGEGAPVSLAS